jgi:NitT/TauT family transport system substrate-binding protein
MKRDRRSSVPAYDVPHDVRWGRREFVKGLSALAGSAGLLGFDPRLAAAEPPPETTKLRLFEGPVTCIAPQLVAEELLRSEGFTDVQYVKYPSDSQNWPPDNLLSGEVDISLAFVPSDLLHIDSGDPVVILGGSHIGCVEVIGGDRIRSTPDLKGKTVAIPMLRTDEQIFISMFAAYVGLDPHKDINWVISPHLDDMRLLTEGKIDAFMTGPPWAHEIHEKKIGHTLVSTTTDKPWSQYFCCLITSTKDFVHKHPVATKRALRAILKAADVCALEPNRVARLIADKGLAPYDYTLQTLRQIPYGKWREFNPEDTVRFFALRMREVGIIKSSPSQIIAQGTDWRFLNELKKELKA